MVGVVGERKEGYMPPGFHVHLSVSTPTEAESVPLNQRPDSRYDRERKDVKKGKPSASLITQNASQGQQQLFPDLSQAVYSTPNKKEKKEPSFSSSALARWGGS